MNNRDILQRFLFENASVRGEVVHLEQSFQTIVQQHNYPPAVRRLLGEVLAAVCLLSATIKFTGRLSLQFQGKSKLKLLLAQCDNQFHIRGLAQWKGDLSYEELLNSLKQGTLVITIDPEKGGKRYQGVVAWQGNSIAESVEGYFQHSEQLPTRIWLAANEQHAAGLLLQVLPAEGHPKTKKIAGDDNWERITYLTSTVTAEELLNLNHENLLYRLYHEEEVRVFQPVSITFQCTCSVERGEKAVLFLGRDEVEQELKDKQKIVVTCEFCSKEYIFDRVDVAKIFKHGDKPSSSTQVH